MLYNSNMKKLKLYLETSIFNVATSDQSPENRDATLKLFAKLNSNEESYDIYTSLLVLQEIDQSSDKRAKELRDCVNSLNLEILEEHPEIENIAGEYISKELITINHIDDARHVATATYYELDIIVSWNFEHIVKYTMRKNITLVNSLIGYKSLEILAPMEVD